MKVSYSYDEKYYNEELSLMCNMFGFLYYKASTQVHLLVHNFRSLGDHEFVDQGSG
jgi:hypothetical protein